MRVLRRVAGLMMPAMHGHPPEGAALQRSRSQECQRAGEKRRADEAFVRQQTMETDGNTEAGQKVKSEKQNQVGHVGPKEKSRERRGVHQDKCETNGRGRETGPFIGGQISEPLTN